MKEPILLKFGAEMTFYPYFFSLRVETRFDPFYQPNSSIYRVHYFKLCQTAFVLFFFQSSQITKLKKIKSFETMFINKNY